MVNLTYFILLLSISLPVYANESTICPSIQNKYHLKYETSKGPDFYVCYAINEKKENVFSLYIGFNPNVDFSNSKYTKQTIIDGKKAKWFKTPKSTDSNIKFESVVEKETENGTCCYKYHFSLLNNSTHTTKRTLEILSKLKL